MLTGLLIQCHDITFSIAYYIHRIDTHTLHINWLAVIHLVASCCLHFGILLLNKCGDRRCHMAHSGYNSRQFASRKKNITTSTLSFGYWSANVWCGFYCFFFVCLLETSSFIYLILLKVKLIGFDPLLIVSNYISFWSVVFYAHLIYGHLFDGNFFFF